MNPKVLSRDRQKPSTTWELHQLRGCIHCNYPLFTILFNLLITKNESLVRDWPLLSDYGWPSEICEELISRIVLAPTVPNYRI